MDTVCPVAQSAMVAMGKPSATTGSVRTAELNP